MYVSLWLQALLILQYSVAVCEQQILAHEAQHRNATLSDANDIATILITAFSPLPSWQYLYQFREDFPEEHRRCVRSGVVQILSKASTHAEVIEAPTDSNVTLAAVAIWTRNPLRTPPSSHLLSRVCMHRDLNITRAIDYDHKFTAEKQKHIDEKFGTDQLYLEQLATHPDYQSRGAGTRLVNSGTRLGREAHVNVTLIAEPTAETFYLRLGFVSVANMSITSVDDDQSFRYNVMAFGYDGVMV